MATIISLVSGRFIVRSPLEDSGITFRVGLAIGIGQLTPLVSIFCFDVLKGVFQPQWLYHIHLIHIAQSPL